MACKFTDFSQEIKMKLKVFKPEDFKKLETAWKTLEVGEDMTAFQMYDWCKNINALYFKERTKKLFREWIYILVTENDEPVMIAPVQVVKVRFNISDYGIRKAFYFIGRQGYSDYLNFIYKDFSPEAVELVIKYLLENYKVRQFMFEQLLENTDFYRYLNEKCTTCYKQSLYCAALKLPHTFDEYKKMLSKSTRQNIRTAINRQNRDGINLHHEMIFYIDDEMSETLAEIRAIRLKDKQRKTTSEMSLLGKTYNLLRDVIIKLFNAKHDILKENCHPWCFLVKKDDRIVGYFWGIRNEARKEYYVILAGVDKEFAWYSPSISHLYLYIKEQYEQDKDDIKILDFTRGGEGYKKDLGASKKNAYVVRFKIEK